MGKGRITLTRDGHSKLVKELEVLKGEKRREIAQALSEARAMGDLSENAEYDAAKESQALNEKKIAEIEGILLNSQLIETADISTDEVSIGTKVKVLDKGTNEEYVYMFVSEEESDFSQNKISTASPVGRALLGHKIGDIVEIKVPAGIIEYEVLSIEVG